MVIFMAIYDNPQLHFIFSITVLSKTLLTGDPKGGGNHAALCNLSCEHKPRIKRKTQHKILPGSSLRPDHAGQFERIGVKALVVNSPAGAQGRVLRRKQGVFCPEKFQIYL